MPDNPSSPFLTSDRLALFPETTRVRDDRLFIAGHDLASLADRHLTPLYIYDRATLDACAVEYRSALQAYYPGRSHITYAGKAFLCRAIAAWTQAHNLSVDCTGEGEIAIARAGGVPRENILVHGVNKSIADLQAAIEYAGTLVVDNLTELERVVATSVASATTTEVVTTFPNLWLRLLPGVAVRTHHAHTQTGQHDSKFGMTRQEILPAARFCKDNNLPLKGIHFHQGSNFRDPEPLLPAIELALDLAKEIGLAGELRMTSQMAIRLREAAKLGFKMAIIPKAIRKAEPYPKDIEIIEVRSVQQALDAALHAPVEMPKIRKVA